VHYKKNYYKNQTSTLFKPLRVIFKKHLTEIKKIGLDVWLWGQYVYQISSQSEIGEA
jgi:hypothetical protein